MTGLAEMGLIERKYNRYNISCKIKGTDVKGTFIIYHPAPDVDVEVEQEISDDDELTDMMVSLHTTFCILSAGDMHGAPARAKPSQI